MSRNEKLYQKIKNNPKDVSFQELERLMTSVGGFSSKPGKGDHYRFTHPELDHPIIVDSGGKKGVVKTVYVKKCLKYFELLNPSFKEKEEG